jgi:UPF0716 family protein affecting phage T7 exclusion
LTDIFGFALMVPKFRKSIVLSLKKAFSGNFSTIKPNSKKENSFKNSKDDVIDV